MKNQGRYISLITGGIVVALVGLLSLQGYLLWLAFEQKEQAFDRNVIAALNTVSQKLETKEAAGKIFSVVMQTIDKRLPPYTVGGNARSSNGIKKAFLPPPHIFSGLTSDSVSTRKVTSDGHKVRVEIFESHGLDTSYEFPLDAKTVTTGKKNRRKSFGYSYSVDNNNIQFKTTAGDSIQYFVVDTSGKKRKELVSKVVDRLAFVERLPIDQRLNKNDVDSVLKLTMGEAGIHLPFHFGIFAGNDSLKISSDSTQFSRLRESQMRSQLFPSDVLSPRYDIALFFPDRTSFVLKEMILLLFLSLLFSAVITASFVVTIRTIVRQKRFATSVVDFINNMTHEFKTPISTIALAAEAIAKPDVLRSKQKVLRYNSVIVDENIRMGNQVDKILQMAVLEEGEYELKETDVEMIPLIDQAIDNIALQVEQRGGRITKNYKAKDVMVKGDVLHLTNIVHNILENANKYSPKIPAITVEAEKVGSQFILRISDSGVGLKSEDAERVFERYYRVSTGNMHDVKGFGLGLSYVKLMVEAHSGSVSISSTLGKGTTVEVRLPCLS